MEVIKQKQALGFSLVSFIIGICFVPLWLLLSLTEVLWVCVPPIVALAGFVLGVIGLILSIRKETRSKKVSCLLRLELFLIFSQRQPASGCRIS